KAGKLSGRSSTARRYGPEVSPPCERASGAGGLLEWGISRGSKSGEGSKPVDNVQRSLARPWTRVASRIDVSLNPLSRSPAISSLDSHGAFIASFSAKSSRPASDVDKPA